MKKKGKRIAAVLLLAFVLFFVWRRISKPKEEIEKKALPSVTVLTPEKEDLAVKTELLGTMTASAEYRLISKISGEVLSIYKENGDTVKAGEKIALLDNQKQIDAAKYSLEQAKAQEQAAVESRNRLAALRDAGDVSQQEFETVDAQAKASSAQVKAAKLNYDTQVEFANIVSPTDGVLQNSILLQGAFVPQGTQLLSVIGDGAEQVVFSVTDELMKNLQPGQEITVEKGEQSYSGSITEISSVIVPETGLFPVKARVENVHFPEGTKVKLSLVKESRSMVMTIPLNVIYYEKEEPFVYVLEKGKGEEGVLRKRSISLGLVGEEKAEVVSGLKEGEELISSWNNEMYDGAKVRLEKEAGSVESKEASSVENTEKKG